MLYWFLLINGPIKPVTIKLPISLKKKDAIFFEWMSSANLFNIKAIPQTILTEPLNTSGNKTENITTRPL